MSDMAKKAPHEAPVEEYAERPLAEALADPKDIEAAENRPEKDEIEDYHKDNPTLQVSTATEKAIEKVAEENGKPGDGVE